MRNLASWIRGQNWLYRHHFRVLPKLFQGLIFVFYSSAVKYTVRIGDGTYFNHKGFGVLVNEKVVIGRDCKIGNNVSIVGQGPYCTSPVIGNRVFIGPGAVIQGPVDIEDNVIIAPNSVVNNSVPEGAIVAGIPAKIIGWSRDLDYDIFSDESWKEGRKPYLTYDKQ